MEGPHPHSVSTRTTDARWRPGPRKGLETQGTVKPAIREQVRRLGRASPQKPRLFTSRLQPDAQRMSPVTPPQGGTAGLRGFRAICRSRPICRGRRFQRRLSGRCVASAQYVLPTAATTATAGVGELIDPDRVACPHTRPSDHTPAQNYADSRKGSVFFIPAQNPCKNDK